MAHCTCTYHATYVERSLQCPIHGGNVLRHPLTADDPLLGEVLKLSWQGVQERAMHDPTLHAVVHCVERQGVSREQALMTACVALSLQVEQYKAQVVKLLSERVRPLRCQYCSQVGHTADECQELRDRQVGE